MVSSVGEPLAKFRLFPSLSGIEEIKKTISVGEPLEFVCLWGNIWTKIDPDVPRFDLSNFSEIQGKYHFISRIVSVGPDLGIALSRPIQPISEIVIPS